MPKAKKIKSFDDFVEWLGGKESARENLLIRIEDAGSIAKFSEKLKVNAGTMLYWIKKIKDGAFVRPLRKGGGSDSGRKLKDDDARGADLALASGQARILPKVKIGSFEDFVKWLGGEEEALDTLSARIKKMSSAANLIRQIKVNEGTFYGWVKKLKSRKTESNPKPEKNSRGSKNSESGSASKRVLLILKDKETARNLILKHESLQSLADYLNQPGGDGAPVKHPVSPNNLSLILASKFELGIRSVLKEGGSRESGSGKKKEPSFSNPVLVKEVRRIEILSEDQKNELIALAEERKAISLKSLFTLLDDNGENLPAAAGVLYDLGIIKRNTPADYMPLKRAVFGS